MDHGQYPEKLIPLLSLIYLEKYKCLWKGLNRRDWIYVEDHIDAILIMPKKKKVGKLILLGAEKRKTNKDSSKTNL